jgi:hypothetical protein
MNAEDTEVAVQDAYKAFNSWKNTTAKVIIMKILHVLVPEQSNLVVTH